MQTLNGRVLSVLKLQSDRKGDQADGEKSAELNSKYWRLRVSYHGPQTLYEMELREPLRSLASKKQTVGLNGLVEFEMSSEPQVAAGDSILIDAYEPGEKILGGGH
jgi:hypothetical protein